MDSFEDKKTELVPDSLRHAQPMRSIAQQTRCECQPTRMADKSAAAFITHWSRFIARCVLLASRVLQ